MVNKKIQLDFTEEGLREKIEVVQGDTGRVLICNIIGVDMTNVSARFYAVKNSGKEIYNNCTVSQNTVTIELTEQTLAEVGIVKCQLDLRKGDQKVQSFIFDIDVTASLMAQSEYLSSDEYKVVDDLADKVEKNENKIAELDDKKANKDDYGSPLQAKTVAEMTDKKKVYVYVGTETGYINGNWYTWKETAWVSGGVYNSAAIQTDKTLTQSDKAADSAIVGQRIGELKESINDLKASGANNESLITIYDILSKGTYTEDISSLMSQLDGLVHDGMYKITSDVKNATLSNKSNYVAKGSKYTCTVTASLGYKISAVVVTMGGIDISSNYDTTTKTITIESVTGPINITITTIESDYTSLQYIKGDGNSWIDTGVAANVNHRYELSAKLDGDDADEYFFGADQYNVGSAYNQFIMVAKANHTKIIGTINKNGNIDVGSWNKTENNLLSNKKMYLVVKNGSQEIYLNSSYTEKQSQYIAGSASFGTQDTLPIIPLYLFHVNTTASTNSSTASGYKHSKITVYWLKIYDDTTNEMLHEFLPVAKNGKIGMFDTVTKEFHANIGTGTFAYEEA